MTISLVSALCVRENVVRLSFDAPIYFSSVLDPGDASELTRYQLSPDESSIGGDGLSPRDVWPARAQLPDPEVFTVVDLWVDRRFSPFPSRYSVKVNGLLAFDRLSGLAGNSAEFFAVRAGVPSPTPEAIISNADIANPQSLSTALGVVPVPSEAVLGTYPVDDTGDVAHDQGLTSYKKRCLRRLSTPKGRHRHLPQYGVGIPQAIKLLARPSVLQALAADAEDQLRQEPETVKAQIKIVMQGGVAFFRCRVRCSLAVDPIDLLAPVPTQP